MPRLNEWDAFQELKKEDPKWIKDNIEPKLDSSAEARADEEKPVRKAGRKRRR